MQGDNEIADEMLKELDNIHIDGEEDGAGEEVKLGQGSTTATNNTYVHKANEDDDDEDIDIS